MAPAGEDQPALGAFYAVLEQVRPEVDAALEAAALKIGVFETLIRNLDPIAREQQAELSRAQERAALLGGEWDAYRESLRAQGATYAHLGVAFDDWYGLLRPYREVILSALPAEREAQRDVLRGMGLFLDFAMASIGEAYVKTKQDLVREAEAQLDLYVQMFRSSPVGKLIFRWESPPDVSTLRLVAANPAALAMNGAATLASLQEAMKAAAAGSARRELAEQCARAIASADPQIWTARPDAKGERIHDCRCFPFGGNVVGVTFEDITDRRRLRDNLARHVRELQRSNRELDEFAYVASHDLKAPLRDIDSLAKWIEEDAAEILPEGSRRHLATLQDRIVRMEHLLDDLLQYSRAGRASHSPESFDLRTVVEDVVSLAAPEGAFAVTITGEALRMCTPRVPLELVLRNLVSNARKHHHLAAGHIGIAFRTVETMVELCVSDDGPGILPELHERVFGMFQTLRPRDEVEGSGMGLAIVKKVVETHGGEVELDSAPGRGSTFRFTWPIEWSPAE